MKNDRQSYRRDKPKRSYVRELIEYVARALVDDPLMVKVQQERSGNKLRIRLQVAKEDMGRVIGKGGKVANSLRILSRVPAARDGKQVFLDVVEPN